MRLIFTGKILKDDKSLSDYKIVDGCKMALIVRKITPSKIQEDEEEAPVQEEAAEPVAD